MFVYGEYFKALFKIAGRQTIFESFLQTFETILNKKPFLFKNGFV